MFRLISGTHTDFTFWSVHDQYWRDKLIVAGRGFFSRVAGFVAGRGFLTKIAGFFAGIFFAGFFSQVLISCYAVLARGGEMYINIGSQTDVFFSKYKVYFLVFCWYIVGFDIDI